MCHSAVHFCVLFTVPEPYADQMFLVYSVRQC